MFNMGGPIKQGIMNNIREPYKGGGKAALVGNPVYPQTGGREHHAVPLLALAPSIARAIPAVYRGFKAARTFAPGKLGKFKRLKSLLSPSGRFRNVAGKKRTDPSAAYMKGDFTASAGTAGTAPSRLGIFQALKDPTRLGAAIRENPLTALSSLTLPNLIGTAAYKAAPGAAKGALGIAKRYADAIIPGDQSSWYTPEEPPKGIEKPGGYPKATVTGKGSDKPLTKAQQEKWADAQRSKRLDNLLDIMGYDRSKKTAIADALIDASKIVSDRGTLDRKNITAELINPIIQATSKRLDKPDQIREAVGLMATKAEIEKDLSKERDALKTTLTKLQIKGAENTLKESESFEGALGKFLSDRKGAVDKATLERISRLFADAHGETFTVIEEGTEPTGDGLYMIDSGIYRVTDGNAKQIA